MRCAIGLLTLATCVLGTADVRAAGLIWRLPEDGSAATYRGTYTLLVRRTDTSQQNQELSWTRVLTIRSVGTETAEYRGQTQACRWVEFEQTTGLVEGGQVVPGPGGQVVLKVLVPEALVLPGVADNRGIPVSQLPIVRGWQQVDEGQAVELTSDGVDLSPAVTLLGFPRGLDAGGAGGTMAVAGANVTTSDWTGEEVVESATQRATKNVSLTRSDETPFGVVKWAVTVELESKGSTEDRSEFAPASTMTEEMTLVEISSDAVSRLEL